MHYLRYPQAPLSAVAVTTQTIQKPWLAQNAMAEVTVGAGSGTTSIRLSGSNDGTNFTNIGSAVTSTKRAVALDAGGQVYLYYRAVTTTITNTKATQVIFYFN